MQGGYQFQVYVPEVGSELRAPIKDLPVNVVTSFNREKGELLVSENLPEDTLEGVRSISIVSTWQPVVAKCKEYAADPNAPAIQELLHPASGEDSNSNGADPSNGAPAAENKAVAVDKSDSVDSWEEDHDIR